jgi:NAD(P)H dehydrogenase (quinone)
LPPKTYPLFGPVEMDYTQIAAELSAVLGRTISYTPSTLGQYQTHLQTYGLPEFLIQHFMEVAVDYQNGIFAGADGEQSPIERITGKAPQTVRGFVEANREVFG